MLPGLLIVDSSADQREALGRLAAKLGFEVWSAATAEEGLQLVRTAACHVVVVALSLTDMPGEQFAATLKHEAGPARPLIIASSRTASRRDAALEHGCDLFVGKPDGPSLLEILKAVAISFGAR